MSLINDALKRAKQAQAQTSPPATAGPPLRPVEQARPIQRPFGLLLPTVLIAIIGIGLFLVWGRLHKTQGSEAKAKTDKIIETTSVREPTVIPPTKPSEPSHQPSKASDPKEQGETVVFGPASGGQPLASETKQTIPNAAIVPVEKPVATTASVLKLTGIVFHPTHPAAMIGGKTLFLNDKLGDWRVVAIGRESATLSNAGQTNVLSLAP